MKLRAPHRRRLRAAVVASALAVSMGGLAAGQAVAVQAPPAAAATTSCSAAYSVSSDWGTGFTAAITVTNTGSTAITGWTLSYTYTGNQTLSQGWSGNWSQTGETVTVTNASWNGSLAAGANTQIGANFSYSGTNAAPASVTCTPAGSGPPPPPPGSIVANPTSLQVTQGSTGTFTLALSTAPPANVTVSIAASGNSGLTASPTTLTFTPSNFATPQTVTVTANSSGTGTTTFTASASNETSATITATENPSGGGGSCGSGVTLQANPPKFSVGQGQTEVIGVSLNEAPSSSISVSVARTSGNSGLSVSSGAPVTLSSSNWNLPQPVYVAADSSSTGAATFTISAPGCTSVTVTGTETAAGSGTTPGHVVNPFTGASWYVNPDYTAEANSSASKASGTLATQMQEVGKQPTSIWLDHIGAIYGGTDNVSGINGTDRLSLQAQLQNAVAADSSGSPMIVPIVIYDLPDRDCAALASNGELSISNNGLSYYEHAYIDPIAQILSDYTNTNLRIVATIEPDSLPNLVTNQSVANCSQANSSGVYTSGIEYALNKLHAIPNVYNYLDIAHSAWLGWSSNFGPAVTLFHQVAAATTAGVKSVDGFISDTANYIPVHEPYMTATEQVDGNPVDSVTYYSFDPYIDEFTYDQAMYNSLVSAGFPSTIGMLIDTSRDGWGGPNRPSGPCSTSTCTTTAQFVNASKVDQRPFRGEWCNIENAGIGAFPQASPDSTFPNLYAYIWVKPPGESDGTYPAFSGKGDPHCDPNGSYTDGNGNTYVTDAIPDSPPAGTWFPVAFQQLVQNADPAIP
jgi:cellulose 1,4-beta-cellobiosidase